MKKIVLAIASVFLISLFASPGFADQKNYGCGLGSMAFERQEGLVSQTFAATTNGILGNQTFGITSGTSNCARPASLTFNERLYVFVAENMDSLAKDIARGNGEYLNTLAVLMEVAEGSRAGVYSRLQANFTNIYTSQEISYLDVINNIQSVISPT